MATATVTSSAKNSTQTAAQPVKLLPDMSHQDAIATFTRANAHVVYIAKDGTEHAGVDALNAFIADRLNKAAAGGKCAISLADFLKGFGYKTSAKADGGEKNDSPKVAFTVDCQPREFKGGSFGFWGQNRVDVTLADGRTVKALCQTTVTIIGSKEAPRK